MRGNWIELAGDWLNTPLTSASPSSRRGMLGRLGLVLGGLVGLGAGAPDLDAKKKKKKKRHKKQHSEKPPKPSDFAGKWSTKLSNGVKGTANFTYDGTTRFLSGTYSNSVGSGTLGGYVEQLIIEGSDETYCSGEYAQGDGETGSFIITISDRNHWDGTYIIDSSGYYGSWSGVRK